jgi:hypothetical protein
MATEAQRVRDLFAPELRKAQEQGDHEKYESLLRDVNFEASEHWDNLSETETYELVRRARRQLVSVPARVFDEVDEEGNFQQTYWEMGKFGAVFLKREVYDALAKEVRDAERETNKHRFALLGVVNGVVGLLFTAIALIFTYLNIHNAQRGIDQIEHRIEAQEKQASEMRGVVAGLQREQSNIELALIRTNPPAKPRRPAVPIRKAR